MDTEALGKYTWAMDRAKKICADLTRKAKELGAELGHCHGHNFEAGLMPQFEAAKTGGMLEEMNALYAELVNLCHEANIYAPRCGRPLMRFSTPDRQLV